MSQILRLEDTDSRLEFGPELPRLWSVVTKSGETRDRDGTYHHASTPGSEMYLLFRCTSISIYGRTGPGGGSLQLRFDGVRESLELASTTLSDNSVRLWHREGLADGDHQVMTYTNAMNGSDVANIWVDYIELGVSAGTGIDPVLAGINATEVPKEAKVVNNVEANLQYDTSLWKDRRATRFYSPSSLVTVTRGASLTYTFEGVAIWYYSDRDVSHGFFTISIDDSPAERLSGEHPDGHVTRQMLWAKTNLSAANQHTFTLTHDDTDGKPVTVDFFRVLGSEDASALVTVPSSAPSTLVTVPSSAPSSDNQSRRLALAIGLPIGILGLGCIVLFIILYRRKRRHRLSLDLTQDPHPWQSLPFDPSLMFRRKREQPVLPLASSALRTGPVYTGSPHVRSLGSPGMTEMSLPPYPLTKTIFQTIFQTTELIRHTP